MFDISPRHRALFERAPGTTVTAMVYGKLAYRHEPQAIKPASRPPIAPWSLAATPTDRSEVRASLRQKRVRKQAPTSALRTVALVAAFNAHRAKAA